MFLNLIRERKKNRGDLSPLPWYFFSPQFPYFFVLKSSLLIFRKIKKHLKLLVKKYSRQHLNEIRENFTPSPCRLKSIELKNLQCLLGDNIEAK